MITKSGAKLLDFGLARTVGLGGVPGSTTHSPTMSHPLTASAAGLKPSTITVILNWDAELTKK